MKKFIKQHKDILVFILGCLLVWRLGLFIVLFLASHLLVQRQGFLGQIPWANFDGVHYLSIAQNGYFQYEQAFFPLFPLLIKGMSYLTMGNYVWAGMILVHIFLFFWLFLLYKLLLLDFTHAQSKLVLICYLLFPTSFFLGSVYTESLFLFLVTAAFYAARKEKWIIAALCISFASATKLIGIFLLPAVLLLFYLTHKKKFFVGKNIFILFYTTVISMIGLISYMIYLGITYKDPLFFIHAQPAFGANRTGGTLIFLPQVMYRYIKIFMTVSFKNYDTWIALLEFSMIVGFLCIICYGAYKRKLNISYWVFSFLAIIGPTLTGSLSSMPRYVLVAFPVFVWIALIKKPAIKIIIFSIFVLLSIILIAYFTSGYFIA